MDHFVEGAGGCFCSRGKPRPVWEIVTRFGRRFRVAVSPRGSIGKLHPSLNADFGTQFPLDASTGKLIPFRCSRVGCGFRSRPVWEAMAQNSHRSDLSIERRCVFALSCMVTIG